MKNLMRERSPRWADLAGGAVLLALLVAIGDSATDLMYWQMGAPGANLDQMAALSDRYHNATGSSLVYAISGIMVLLGAIAFGIGLRRSKTVPIWGVTSRTPSRRACEAIAGGLSDDRRRRRMSAGGAVVPAPVVSWCR